MNEIAGRGLAARQFVRRNAQGVDRSLPADAAARSRVEVAVEFRGVDLRALTQRNAHDVGRAPVAHRFDVAGGVDQAFGEEESGRQVVVVAGCAHRDRDRLFALLAVGTPSGADLQRLFDDQHVVSARRGRSADARHRDRGDSLFRHAAIVRGRRSQVAALGCRVSGSGLPAATRHPTPDARHPESQSDVSDVPGCSRAHERS